MGDFFILRHIIGWAEVGGKKLCPHPHLKGQIQFLRCLARVTEPQTGRGSHRAETAPFPLVPRVPRGHGCSDSATWALLDWRSLNPFGVKALGIRKELNPSVPIIGNMYTYPGLAQVLSQNQPGQGHPLSGKKGKARTPVSEEFLCFQLLISREPVFTHSYF